MLVNGDDWVNPEMEENGVLGYWYLTLFRKLIKYFRPHFYHLNILVPGITVSSSWRRNGDEGLIFEEQKFC